jgi:hypothetical protein
MATMTLDGTTMPAAAAGPEGHRVTTEDITGRDIMADGSVRLHHVGVRRRHEIRWVGITSAERTTVFGKYCVRTSQAFVENEGGGSVNVLVVPDSWQENSYEAPAGTYRYDVGLTLEEVTLV